MAKLVALCAEPSADNPMDLSPEPSVNPPTQSLPDSEPPHPPSHIPLGAKWYKSWEEFFQTLEKDDRKHFKTAPEDEKRAWLSWAKNAEKFHAPGKGGARVLSGKPVILVGFSEFYTTNPMLKGTGTSGTKKH